MTPEERRLLIELHDQSKENAKMLHTLYRAKQFGVAFKVLYWTIILGLSFGAFYFLQPYVDTIKGSYEDIIKAKEEEQVSPNQELGE